MMCSNNFYATVLLFLLCASLGAQDRIISFNEDTISVQITELTPEYIRYTEGGVSYKLNRQKIKKVILQESEENEVIAPTHNGPTIMRAANEEAYIVEGLDSKIYAFWELKEYILNDPIAEIHFRRTITEKKRANILGLGALVSLTSGFYLIRKHKGDYPELGIPLLLWGQLLLYGVTPILGTAGIAYLIAANRSKTKTLDAYGVKYLSTSNRNRPMDIATLNVGMTNNGVGLVLQF